MYLILAKPIIISYLENQDYLSVGSLISYSKHQKIERKNRSTQVYHVYSEDKKI